MILPKKLLFLLSVLFLSGKAKSKKRKIKKVPNFKRPKVKKPRAIATDNMELR
jgi:hypothetical protein